MLQAKGCGFGSQWTHWDCSWT